MSPVVRMIRLPVGGRAWGVLAAGFALAMAAAWWSYRASLQDDLEALAHAGRIRVDQAAERLVNQLDSYRVLTTLLAQDPRIAEALAGRSGAETVDDLLRQRVLTYGAERIELVNANGAVIATSDPAGGRISRQGSPLLAAALDGRLGFAHGLEARQRRFHVSRGVWTDTAAPAGAVIVSVDIGALEFEWAVVPEAIGFFDAAGVVVVSNRPSLLLRQDRPPGGADGRLTPFPDHSVSQVGGFDLWRFDAAGELPREALVVTRAVPRLGLSARGFLDVAPARADARLRALLAAALAGLVVLAGLLVALWRRRLADRLAFEEAVNARLQSRVEARTRDLREAQNQLVQASKMTALGQMSAGISHELNQPLAAIRNFAENAGRFLDAGRSERARENFEQISAQVQRIDRIVRNLRAFSRNENEPLEPTDLRTCVREALALSDAALRRAGAVLETSLPETPVTVMGGPVRLQQVIVNLISNALDALADSGRPRLSLALSSEAGRARLVVRDNGPGLAEPARVFEPFYTTKELGASKGLGLGLSISYGIIGSLGGELTAANAPEGGAVFTVDLPLGDAGARS